MKPTHNAEEEVVSVEYQKQTQAIVFNVIDRFILKCLMIKGYGPSRVINYCQC